MAIEVQIRQPVSGTTRVLTFSKSPVRLGRNQLNDIPLEDPFVSEWHGIIRADDRQIAYFDLGSTNGTLLNGVRLAKNVPVVVSETARLQIGMLELSVALRADASAAVRMEGDTRGSGPSKTIGWGVTVPKKAPGDDRNPLDSGTGGAPSQARTPAGSPSPTSGGSPALSPLSQPGSPGPGSSSAPGGMQPRGGGVDARTPPTGGVGEAAAAAGVRPEVLARQARFIEAFSEAFIGLRKGYEQFGAEVGVRTVSGSTPLHRARTARDVVDYIMLPTVDADATTRDLIAIFADFGIHHIALMEGITEGVRTVLQSMDPRANDLDASGRLWTASKLKNQWKKYLERFDLLVTDDQELHAAIFGDVFARAYASVALGDGRSSGGGGEDK